MLLLGFVFLESLFRLVRGEFRVRSPLWKAWVVAGGLLLLFSQVLLLYFNLRLVAIVDTVDAVLVLPSSHHDHARLILNRQTLSLSRLRVVLLAIVSCELVFVLQERVLTYVVLLLLGELLPDWAHYTLVLAGRSVDFINLFFALIQSCAARLIRLYSVVGALVRNAVF